MARLNFTVGTRFLLDGHVYMVSEMLLEDRVRLDDQSFGGTSVMQLAELYEAWGHGELRFALVGRNTNKTQSSPVPTEYSFADFGILPAHQRDEAWRRYRLIQPLLKLQPHERSKEALEAYAASIAAPVSADAYGTATGTGTGNSSETDATKEKPRAYRKGGTPASRASLMRWLKDFRDSGYDIRSLVPATHERGGKGKSRIDSEVNHIIEQVLADCAASPQYRRVQDVYEQVVNKIADENRFRPEIDRLPLPGYLTVYRRIVAARDKTILRRRPSRVEAHEDEGVQGSTRAGEILERVEIDHTTLDIFVVDTKDRLPIGRPTLTLALDSYSGMPFGWYLGFELPSYLTVMSCLEHGILTKPDVQTLYGTKYPWPVFGLPKQLVVDRGKEFVGRDLSDACAQLDIELKPLPARHPWLKGAIERHFRSTNTGLIHGLPGTSFSNILDRGDYDAMKNACISLESFIKVMHIWLLDYYAQRWHEGKRGVPYKLWLGRIESGVRPALPHSAEELRVLLGRVEERTVQPKGIELWALRYQSADLIRLRTMLPKGATVRIKYDPRDIGYIHVLDTTQRSGPTWIKVPARDPQYTAGLSLWAHEKIRAYTRRTYGEVDIYALAEAKRHIQEVVAEEFKLTRKARGRSKAQRFLGGVGTAQPDATPALQTQRAQAPTGAQGRTARAATPTPKLKPQAPAAGTVSQADPDDFDMSGFGADFGLPHQRQEPGGGTR